MVSPHGQGVELVRTRGGGLQMRTSALFGAKSLGFFDIYVMVCPHGHEGGG